MEFLPHSSSAEEIPTLPRASGPRWGGGIPSGLWGGGFLPDYGEGNPSGPGGDSFPGGWGINGGLPPVQKKGFLSVYGFDESFQSTVGLLPICGEIPFGVYGVISLGGGGDSFRTTDGFLPVSRRNFVLSPVRFLPVYSVKKGYWFSRPQPGCLKPDSPWAGNNQIFRPGRVWLVTSRLGTGKSLAFFLQCMWKFF